MANYLKERQWYIDTAVDIAPPSWGNIYVKDVRWENYAASGSLVVTTDTGGTIINQQIPASGESTFIAMRFGPFGWANSFHVTTITAGTNITVTVDKA